MRKTFILSGSCTPSPGHGPERNPETFSTNVEGTPVPHGFGSAVYNVSLLRRCTIYEFTSIRNLRDAGGLHTSSGKTIRTGLLYRSGDLADASQEDLQGLADLGIKTIIDLRAPGEARRHPDRLPENGEAYFHFPVQVSSHKDHGPFREMLSHLFAAHRNKDYHKMMENSYREYVSQFQLTFARVVRLASDPSNLPMLVHCTAGKDRTGFSISLIQRALGVSQETAMQNYLLSNRAVESLKQTMQERFGSTSFLGLSYEHFTPLMEARAAYLESAFDEIDKMYGSLGGYLKDGLAITGEEISSLTKTFLPDS